MDPLGPKSILLASTLIARFDYTLTDLQSYINKLQYRAKFTRWSCKSIKVEFCNVPPHNQTVFSLFNSTEMCCLFANINQQYRRLLKKKAHIHTTTVDNFEEQFFEDCSEALQKIIQKYKKLSNVVPVDLPRLKPFKTD